jgi:hypothetical protein
MRKRDYAPLLDKRQSRRERRRLAAFDEWIPGFVSAGESAATATAKFAAVMRQIRTAAFTSTDLLQAGWNRMTATQEQLRTEGGDYMNMIAVAKRSLS